MCALVTGVQTCALPIYEVADALLGLEKGGVEGPGRRAIGGNLGRPLPIAVGIGVEIVAGLHAGVHRGLADATLSADGVGGVGHFRSEARRVGQEFVRACRSRWSPYPLQKNISTK